MRLFKLLSTTYDEFDQTVRDFLTKAFNGLGQHYSKSSIYGVVFQGIKGVMQNIMFYIEDAMTEQNIFTATRKKSIYSLAKISGCDAWYGSCASGTVYLTNKVANALESGSTKIAIPNYTILRDENSNEYVMMMSDDSIVIDMSKPLVKKEVKIVQGIRYQASYIAKGQKLETFSITPPGFFDLSYVEVRVNGTAYTSCSSMYDMRKDECECVVTAGYDGGLSVMFGDGNYGKKLSEGDSVTVTYMTHSGSLGNISPTAKPTLKFKSYLTDGLGNDIDGNDYINISIGANVTGGSDSDTIAVTKSNIGCNSRALVISSVDNFKLFLSRFSFISFSNILTYDNSLCLTICPVSNIKDNIKNEQEYFGVKDSDVKLSDYQKDMVRDGLVKSQKVFAGLSVSIIDPIIRKFAVIGYVKASSQFIRETVKNNIKNVIADYFMSLDNNTQFIAKSDIIKEVIDNVDGIESFDIDIISKDDEEGRATGYCYTHEVRDVNSSKMIVEVRKTYDESKPVALDRYGNISLQSLLEVPMLRNGIKTYPDDNYSDAIVMQEAVEIHFI